MDFFQVLELSDKEKINYLLTHNKEMDALLTVEIIDSLKDEELRVYCLMHPDIILTSYDKSQEICSIKERKLILFCLTSPKIGLDLFDKLNVLFNSSHIDDELKIYCLTNPSVGIVGNLNSSNIEDIEDIILSLEKDESKISCITNPDIILDSLAKAKIIVSLKDEKNKMECLENTKLGLQAIHKAMIISSLEDDEKKISYMQDSTMGFNEKDELLISCSLKNKENLERFGVIASSYKKLLGLPENMSFGVELEAEGENAKYIRAMKKMLGNWKVENDGTLENGIEIISPILHDKENDIDSLSAVCNIMKKFELYTNDDCGRAYTFWCRLFRKGL